MRLNKHKRIVLAARRWATSLIITVSSLVLTATGCAQKIDLPEVDNSVIKEARTYLETSGMAPDQYVIKKFQNHDVIFLGESHYNRHDPVFIQELIPVLYENGIRTLATEFARREDQNLVDSLLAGDEYNGGLAREIQFRQNVLFGFREYIDIFEVAWTLNQSLGPDDIPFRIIAMNNSPDWSFVKTKADRDSDEVKRKVWHGETEEDWAKVVLDAVNNGEKVLVYCGMHHAFSKYKQPAVNFQTGEFYRFDDSRVGNFVFRAIGNRALTISLHHAWHSSDGEPSSVYAADGYIDAVMHELGDKHYPAGFDIAGSPFADFPGETSAYKYGYEKFKLAMFCDGYIYRKPLSEYEGVSPIERFVNEKNIDRARLATSHPKYRDASPEEFFVSLMKIANVQWKYRKFK
ncbi:MAG: ChaN family lipoprotein [Candidatus Latescibacterota bacterium]|nr:MAG: ChaN family lipoprotein [Candidatus Latescibacterota bacterium]